MTLAPEAETLVPPPETRPPKVRSRPGLGMLDGQIMRRAIADSFSKLNPKVQARNPVMFVVLVGSLWTTILFFRDLPSAKTSDSVFVGLVSIWLWFTVLFASLLFGVVVIVVGLTYFPVVSLGPIVEHLVGKF